MNNIRPDYLPDYKKLDKKQIEEKIENITSGLSIATINALNIIEKKNKKVNNNRYNDDTFYLKKVITQEDGNNEPKQQSVREQENEKSIFLQVLEYLNTLKPGENNQELASKISTYFKENKDKNLSSKDIPEIYILLNK